MTARQPRVWLAGDTVPAGVACWCPNNYVNMPQPRDYRAATPLVEVFDMPPFGELVKAEKARRATEEEVTT